MRGWLAAAFASHLLAVALAAPAGAVLTDLPPGFVDELVIGGLSFPTAVAFMPDGRLLVALKDGRVRIYQGSTLLGTFVDLRARVHDNHDRGLLGIAVHPEFPDEPYVYLLYTHDPPGANPDGIPGGTPPPTSTPARVAQLLRVEADPATGHTTAKAGTEVVLIGNESTLANIGSQHDGRNVGFASCISPLNVSGVPISSWVPVEDCIPSDEDSHTIGSVAFAPDGSLFVTSGDASNYGGVDPRALRAQLLDSLAGKILRIDPITGDGLPDNPYYQPGKKGSNRSKVWAYGVRNPFRIAIEPTTSEPWIGDVGWNTWEEIDTGKGANLGWPCYEGGALIPPESGVTTSRQQSAYRSSGLTSAACDALYGQGLGAVRAPAFAYDHSSGGASANAGAFYGGVTYPAIYHGALFIADYNLRWIRYLTFDGLGEATAHPFGVASTGGPVQLLQGPDTNLYWIQYSGSGGELRRVRYVGGSNSPPVVLFDATPTIGTIPLQVEFDANATYDPDTQPISFLWDFGDGESSTDRNPIHVYSEPGVYDAELTVTEQTAPFASASDTVRITVGNSPPLATIHSPTDQSSYRVGDVIHFSGTATSGPNPVSADDLDWELRTLHNQHSHFDDLPSAPDPVDPFRSVGDFSVSDHGDSVSLQLCVTATIEPEGFTDTQCVDLLPEKTQVTLATEPVGLAISYEDEGIEVFGPALIQPVVGSEQTISVLPIQQHRSFAGWDDGEPQRSRSFTVGTTPLTFTAVYENRAPSAVASPSSANGRAPFTVAFDAALSSDPEDDALEYAWDAGEVGTSSEPAPFTVAFDAALSSDPEDDALEYAWDAGEVGTSGDPAASFTFLVPGTYAVTLTVMDQLGATATDVVAVEVTDCGAQTQPPRRCVQTVNRGIARIARARAAAARHCLADAAAGRVERLGPGGTFDGCLDADVDSRVARATERIGAREPRACSAEPPELALG
ncbi:MAG TPA: PQQ-dependent sugar dehydrogenase, partial [Myxococcota bacterium]|nr:PQQ-dependent sugar dehydrogenase [Myxococcota bacterium]